MSNTSPRQHRARIPSQSEWRKWLAFLGIPALLLVLCFWLQPFSQTLASQTVSTRSLSAAQITNLRVAARYLDGIILEPGAQFSFNRMVGPRTAARGYLPAPSYLGGESPATMGGGICLLSSAIYRLALEAGFPIVERVPHLRTIHSVPPGLDATVWYGRADFKFKNPLKVPVRLMSRVQSGALAVSLQGSQGAQTLQLEVIRREVSHPNPQEITVTVRRGNETISRDRYRLSP